MVRAFPVAIVLKESAIIIHAGEDYEDRKHSGSYVPEPVESNIPHSDTLPETTDGTSPF